MGKLRPFVRKDSYMPNKKWIPFVIGNGYTTTDGASGPAPEYETVTGNPVSFNAITPFPLRQLKVAFSPVQDLNGYDSPWPAGGNVNLLLNHANPGTTTVDGITWTVTADGHITAKGTATANSLIYYVRNNTDGTKLLGDYKFRIFPHVPYGDLSIGLYVDGAWRTSYPNVIASFTVENESPVTELWFRVDNGKTVNLSFAPIIYDASKSPTAWSPYENICPISGWDSLTVYHSGADTSDPQTISIALGSTVYSGTLDVVTGVVTVDRGSMVVDGSTSLSVASNLICNIASQFKGMASAEVGLYKSDTFKAHINSGVANMNNEFTVDGYHVILVKAPSLFTTTAEAKAYFTAHPTTFVAPLATPQTIQLTPQEVSSLLGENNVWSDANGDLTVEYRSN